MIEQTAITETPQQPSADVPPDGADPPLPALEERVRRLEDAVAVLQDTHALEERVVERVTAKVAPAASNGVRESAGLLFEAGRQLLPGAVAVLASATSTDQAPAAPPPATPAPAPRRPWLLYDIYAEFRATVRMYLDPRFRLSWAARLVPLILVPALATSWLWLPGATILNKLTADIVGTLYVKVLDLLMTFVLFKVVHGEVTRYRTTSPDLPPSLRL
ncbi:MAG TPA: hypothetical protein VKA46_41520 [Gemmataceae bacterium]|nr:hypothetical protein [Gemmataceae bacterium]